MQDQLSTLPIVDAHVHFWDLARFRYPWLEAPAEAPLRHTYLPRDLLHDAAGLNLTATVHVQAEMDRGTHPAEETAWLREIAIEGGAGHPPTVCVGYADLRSPALDSVLDGHLRYPSFRGIRQEAWFLPGSQRADVPDENMLDDPAWVAGLAALLDRELVFELLVWPHQLEQAVKIFRDLPGLEVVIEHLGVPGGDGTDAETWRRALAAFATEVPRATLKISGMRLCEDLWESGGLRATILEAVELFGAERCMFGSNYPVDRPVASYREIWNAFDECTRDLSPTERTALFAGTAMCVYGIGD